LAKNLGGKVIMMEFDVDVKKQDGSGSYKAWSLTYRDSDGKTDTIIKPMQGLKFQPALKAALQDLKPGEDFVAEMEKNKNNYFEVTSISKGSALPVQSGGNTQEKYRTDRTAKYEADTDRQTSIVRQSSLKAAVDFVAKHAHAEDCDATTVLTIAEQFEAWVNRKDAE
jgi:hypothetical protein